MHLHIISIRLDDLSMAYKPDSQVEYDKQDMLRTTYAAQTQSDRSLQYLPRIRNTLPDSVPTMASVCAA